MTAILRKPVFALSVILILSACQAAPPVTATPEPTGTFTPVPSATSSPTITPTPTPDLPGLPAEYQSELKTAEAAGKTIGQNDSGQITVNGQPWFEPTENDESGWQETENILLAKTTYQFWPSSIDTDQSGNKGGYICPMVTEMKVLTEHPMTLQGKEMRVFSLTVAMPDQNNPNVLVHYHLPVKILDQNDNPVKGGAGLNLPILYDENGVATSFENFMQLLKRGGQVQVLLLFKSVSAIGTSVIDDIIHFQGLHLLDEVPENIVLPTSMVSIDLSRCNRK